MHTPTALAPAALVLTLAAASAQATVFNGTVEQTLPFAAVFSPGSGGTTVTFDAFDDQNLLEVVAVTLTIDASASITAGLENVSDDPVVALPVRFAPGAGVTFDAGTPGGPVGFSTEGEAIIDGPLSLAATDNVPSSGPDFIDFGPRTLGLAQTWDFTDTDDLPGLLQRLTGGSEPSVSVVPTTFFGFPEGFPAGTAFLRRVDSYELVGDVTLSLTFIPTPGALAVGGLGLGLAARRRRSIG